MIVKDRLWNAAVGLKDILKAGAKEAGFDVEACVTPVEPAWDCGRIHVWPITITTLQDKDCHVAARPTLAYGLAACIGSSATEDCDFWNDGDKTETALSMLWAVYGSLLDSYIKAPTGAGTLCAALGGAPCNEILFGPLNMQESGDFVVYGGSVTFSLGVVKT